MVFSPVERLRHRMSALPSPSKSPIPCTCQAGSATVLREPCEEIVSPFINQRLFSPVALFRQTMSDLQSPSTSICAQTGSARADEIPKQIVAAASPARSSAFTTPCSYRTINSRVVFNERAVIQYLLLCLASVGCI